jgi:hypothetical protein
MSFAGHQAARYHYTSPQRDALWLSSRADVFPFRNTFHKSFLTLRKFSGGKRTKFSVLASRLVSF